CSEKFVIRDWRCNHGSKSKQQKISVWKRFARAKPVKLPDGSGEQGNEGDMPEPSDIGIWIAQGEAKLVPKQSGRNRKLDDLAPRVRVSVQIGKERDQAKCENPEKNNYTSEIMPDQANDHGGSDQCEYQSKVVNQTLHRRE